MERSDTGGRWESDDGVTWALVEPSAEWLAGIPTPTAPDDGGPREQVLSLLASLSPEELSRVITLGLAVTTPDAVTSLTESVATSNPDLGVSVLAEAAQTATTLPVPVPSEED